MNDAKYIGLDVHQATISVAVRDSDGKLVMEAILETKAERFCSLLTSTAPSHTEEPCQEEPGKVQIGDERFYSYWTPGLVELVFPDWF